MTLSGACWPRSSVAANTLIYLLGDNGATTEKRAGLNQQIATAKKNGVFRGFKFSTFGKVVTEVAMTADISPTIFGLTGAELPTDRTINGRDMWLVTTQGARSPHKYVAWAESPQLAIRKGE